jgi:AcrR family transcriptional regulator
MAKEGRMSRSRLAAAAGSSDSPPRPVRPGAADPTIDDVSASRGRRKHLRDRLGERADKLGLKPLPVRPSTKTVLMDVGEILMGRHGVEGVTLREIGLLAGQSNSNVIQYHFDNKEGLILAILADRVRRREKMRVEQLEALKCGGLHIDSRKLIEILWLPILSFRDENGDHSYCRFMLQCRLHPEISKRYPHDERYEGSVIVEVIKLLRNDHPHLSKEIFSARLSTLTLMFVSSVVEFDNLRQANPSVGDFDHRPFVDIAIAALAGPHSEYAKKSRP